MAIVKRGENKYLIRVYQGRIPGTKERIEYNETFRGTYEEAEKREQVLKNKADENRLVKSSRMTVIKLVKLYLETTRYNRGKSTQRLLIQQTKRYIEPYIGNLQVNKVKPSDFQNYFNYLLSPKRRTTNGKKSK